MSILAGFYDELLTFFNFQPVIDLVRSGDYSSLRTLEGMENVVNPLMPFLLVIEIIRAVVLRKFTGPQYKIPLFIYVFNRFVGRYLSIAALAFCVGLFSPYAIFKTSFTWYWLIYGYIVWELGHFVYHYLGHKVRIFWCLHSTHHAPEHMNLSVSFAHFILEAPYADVIRTSTCILLGVNQPLLFFIMFIDGTWGAFIHVGEHLIKDGRLGFLSRVILTPSHHRVHHAKNPLYMDTNFCNLLNIWDRIFGTYQPQRDDIPVVYGITRPMKPGNFLDVYFGEFVALGRDMVKAPGLVNKLLYVVMPPGWSHTGDHKTSRVVRREWAAAQKKILAVILLFVYGCHAPRAQTTYMDSIQTWRKNYVETHELLKTPEERSYLRFYPLDGAYRVACTFQSLPNSPWLPMTTSGAKTKMARKYGLLTFKLKDTLLHLVVFQMQDLMANAATKDYLFVGFTDATSAVDTYGAGRYIDCAIGDIHGNTMELDFNKAYNPYCAYTTGYNCPIPPRENDLPVAILAGEKNYGKKVH